MEPRACYQASVSNKHHVRIKAYGSVDELNSWVGMIRNYKIDKDNENALIRFKMS